MITVGGRGYGGQARRLGTRPRARALTATLDLQLNKGRDWFRLWLSDQGKRAEEADDHLVNDPSENNSSADNSPRAYALAA
jgi:hypothetical protein